MHVPIPFALCTPLHPNIARSVLVERRRARRAVGLSHTALRHAYLAHHAAVGCGRRHNAARNAARGEHRARPLACVHVTREPHVCFRRSVVGHPATVPARAPR